MATQNGGSLSVGVSAVSVTGYMTRDNWKESHFGSRFEGTAQYGGKVTLLAVVAGV